MKTGLIQLIAGITVFVLCISMWPTTVNATLVWSDDFNDGDYNGWTICDNSTLLGGYWGFNGSTWNATNYYLEVTDAPDTWGIISHPSDVANGTWSFDFKDDDFQFRTADTAMVVFMSSNFYDWDDFYQDANFYWIDFDVVISGNFTINLKKRSGSAVTTIASSEVPGAGWHHFDVTRNTTGCFSVYHNDTHIIQGEDTEFDTSELFWFWFKEGQMIDNIVVSDTVDVVCTDPACELCNPLDPTTTTTTTTTPTTPPDGSPDWILIAAVGGAAGAVIVLAIVFLRRR